MQASFTPAGRWFIFDDTQFNAPTLAKGYRRREADGKWREIEFPDRDSALRWIAREEKKAAEAAAVQTPEGA